MAKNDMKVVWSNKLALTQWKMSNAAIFYTSTMLIFLHILPIMHVLTKAQSESSEAVQKHAIHIIYNSTRGMLYYPCCFMQIWICWLRIEKIFLRFFSAILWILPLVSTISFFHPRSTVITSRLGSSQTFPKVCTHTKHLSWSLWLLQTIIYVFILHCLNFDVGCTVSLHIIFWYAAVYMKLRSLFLYKNVNFLCIVQPMPKGDHVLNFSDAEDMINDKDLMFVLLHWYCWYRTHS